MNHRTYTCSLCQYSRQKMRCIPGTRETVYEPRDNDTIGGFAGITFEFTNMDDLMKRIRKLFAPGTVTFDNYGEFIAVQVVATADNRTKVTRETLDAFRAGRCCLWEYSLCLSSNDGSLTGFREGEGIADIPQDRASLDKAAEIAAARIALAWRIVWRERGGKPPFALDDDTVDFTLRALDREPRSVPGLREVVDALRPYTVETYPDLADAYGAMFGCTPERARSLAVYSRQYNEPCLTERMLGRDDVLYVRPYGTSRMLVMRRV